MQFEERTKTCPSCRREIDYYVETCEYCNHKFEVEYDDPRALYIKSNVNTYFKKFAVLDAKNSNLGWNWCGFLFGSSWMIYRKLYKHALFFFFVPIVIEWITLLSFMINDWLALICSFVSLIVSLVLWVLGGLLSDYWYRQKVDQLVKEGSQLSADERKELAEKKGGTSIKMLLLLIGIAFVLGCITGALELAVGL